MEPQLSIMIATVDGREHFFEALVKEFENQMKPFPGMVEIISKKDNKEMSVGAKSQLMLEEAAGKYVVRFDDDDWPFAHYIPELMKGVASGADCIGMLIHMTTNGVRPEICCHSLRYKAWGNKTDGYNYVRNVTHFNPVKRPLALITGYKDLRHGEDKDYADRLTPLCTTEYFINKPLFHYRYTTKMPHKEKYGIQ